MTSGVKSKPPTMLAQRLRWIREDRGWTQARMATALGVFASRVSGWEIGRHDPLLSTLRRYAHLENVTLSELLDGIS